MSRALWCVRYIERFGLKLVPLRGKVPIGAGWNLDANLISTAMAAEQHWTQNPADNVGVCLEPSGLCSLDADSPNEARQVLGAEGIDLDGLMTTTPTIIGRAPRLEFQAPQDFRLSPKAVAWPRRSPDEKPLTVLELRAGRVQDVLPPSIHPSTRRPYQWLTPPVAEFPPLPQSLLALWLDFDAFRRRARNRCPWAEPEPDVPILPPPAPRQRTGQSVIAAFNEAHDTVSILEAHGYQRVGKRRWKSPNGHGVAGVVLLPDSGRVYCHHTSDDLGDNRSHDAFDLYARFDHGGDYRAAVKAAAKALGLSP